MSAIIVLARISPLHTRTPWAFLAIAGTDHGAPHWLLLEGDAATATTRIDAITARLREHLSDDPPARPYDDACDQWLERFLLAATHAERKLIPRRHQRALEQMHTQCQLWAAAAAKNHDYELSRRWRHVSELATAVDSGPRATNYHVAEAWLSLIKPNLELARTQRPNRRYIRLNDIYDPRAVAMLTDAVARVCLPYRHASL